MLHQFILERIVIIYMRRDGWAEINVGYRIHKSGARYPASSEYRCSANGLFDTSAYRDNPFIIRSRCFVQPKGIKLVRFRRYVTRRYVNFYPERNFIDVKLIPYQRTTDESGIFVIGNPTRIAPVGEPVDINEPVIC